MYCQTHLQESVQHTPVLMRGHIPKRCGYDYMCALLTRSARHDSFSTLAP